MPYTHVAVGPQSEEVRRINPPGNVTVLAEGDTVLLDPLDTFWPPYLDLSS